MYSKLTLFLFLFILVPLSVQAGSFTLSPDKASVPSDIEVTAIASTYQWIWKDDNSNPSTWGTNCSDLNDTYNWCRSNNTGDIDDTLSSLFKTGAQDLSLTDGTYHVFDYDGIADCTTDDNWSACETRGAIRADIEICADSSCIPQYQSPTSTTTTIDRAINMADFLVDILGFAIMLGILFLK